jgi:hypothetical protein
LSHVPTMARLGVTSIMGAPSQRRARVAGNQVARPRSAGHRATALSCRGGGAALATLLAAATLLPAATAQFLQLSADGLANAVKLGDRFAAEDKCVV